MTSTRNTMPAPPPNGVVARGSTHSKVLPSASALATCRWLRYHSNQCGNSVKTSTSIDEAQVDVDPAALDVDGAHRVTDQRDQPVAHLQRLARRQSDHALHDPDLGV